MVAPEFAGHIGTGFIATPSYADVQRLEARIKELEAKLDALTPATTYEIVIEVKGEVTAEDVEKALRGVVHSVRARV